MHTNAARVVSLSVLLVAAAICAGCLVLFPVDKQRPLPPGFAPPSLETIPPRWTVEGYGQQRLRPEAARALIAMLADAEEAGYVIRVRSTYRSYERQEIVYASCARDQGATQAARFCAEPGHSEHQLGTTVDVTNASVGWALVQRFAFTGGGIWINKHAHEYGFALSYPRGEEVVTGYAWEPWHFRWIGIDEARRWKASGLTLIEYLERRAR